VKYLRLTWEDIERQCMTIAREIKRREVPFDIIVGIARGGWVPARLLSDMLDNDELHTMRVKFYTGIGEVAAKPVILHPTQIDVTGKKVLLVDDIADTGKSLSIAKKHLEERGAGDIFVVTLIKKPHSEINPDLYVAETDAWVIFPWEVRETLRLILRKAETKEEAEKELARAGLSEEELPDC